MSSSENNKNSRPNLTGSVNKDELLKKKIDNTDKQRPELVTTSKLITTDTDMMWGYLANKKKLQPLDSIAQSEIFKKNKEKENNEKYGSLSNSDSDKKKLSIVLEGLGDLDDSDDSIINLKLDDKNDKNNNDDNDNKDVKNDKDNKDDKDNKNDKDDKDDKNNKDDHNQEIKNNVQNSDKFKQDIERSFNEKIPTLDSDSSDMDVFENPSAQNKNIKKRFCRCICKYRNKKLVCF